MLFLLNRLIFPNRHEVRVGHFGSRRQSTSVAAPYRPSSLCTPQMFFVSLPYSFGCATIPRVSRRCGRSRISKKGGINDQNRQGSHRRARGGGANACGGSRERQGQGESRLYRSADGRRRG